MLGGNRPMHLAFLTSTPLGVARGSGTWMGISTLARAVRALGHEVELIAPQLHLPAYTLERVLFNEGLRRRDWRKFDAVVGFDMDGYRIAGRHPALHVASIKGVIADEMRFERGMTRRTMAVQAACERAHVRRAGLVITTSRYAAGRIRELYGLDEEPQVVPEPIDLALWRELFERNAQTPAPGRFTVLSVCRFYPRKRLDVLLGAAARLCGRVPGLEVRIVGRGPEEAGLRALARNFGLDGVVTWLGDVSPETLAREYSRADVFCLPSVQEGFGIVFLEAMAAGKAIVAARAAAVPEVVPHALLAEPGSEESLAAALATVCQEPARRARIAEEGRAAVALFDAPRVARQFLDVLQDSRSRPAKR
jgi:glycosyltransferase involved in cell wall biosynthesis